MSGPKLRALAPGKINLSLFLGPVRGDGRHELVTLFQPVSLADEVTLSVLEGSGEDQVVCPGVEGPNIVARALAELRARGWDGPPVLVEVAKRIPVAAGMAGGSADAAAVLRLATALRPLPGPSAAEEIAAVLGADVPGQLAPGPALGTGAGDVVTAVPARGSLAFLILPSSEQLSTRAVFAAADRLRLPRSRDELSQRLAALEAALGAGPDLPADLLVNDLEPAARSLLPSIGDALDLARSLGADAALVCGSGPTVAGVFWGSDAPARARSAAAAAGDRRPPAGERRPPAVAVVPVDAGFAVVEDA
ncbi:MAG: 4-diphosphocytidyl-2-C-methyl-D-erythritol kinase [Solirubrobacteraceae bacterium]|nr:4-diphosphocytidyl-2-C-methyl-D-erythritol kinase [Solirubrobacteraceae bacterium]